MPENTNLEVVETGAKDVVMETIGNASSIPGILIGIGVTTAVVLAAWGGSKLYKSRKKKKYIPIDAESRDYDEDYEFDDEVTTD